MKKILDKIRKIWSEIVVFLRLAWIITKKTLKIVGKILWSNPLKITYAIIFGVLVLVEIYGGIMIYAFKRDTPEVTLIAKVIPFPVAIVNYNVITYSNLLHEKNYVHHFYNSTKQEGVDFAQVDQQVYEQLIQDQIVKQEALLHKVKLNKAEIDLKINDLADKNGGIEQVTKVLDDLYGLTVKEFKTMIGTQLLRDKLDTAVIARVKASHILIRVASDATAEQKEAARVKIDGIKKEIEGGLSFADAAKKYSEDTTSAELGGSLDPFAKGEMVDEFSEASFSTPVGQISEPIFTDYGWHIIKVESKTGQIEETFSGWIDKIEKKSLIIRLVK
ncbi:MAG: peptidylprolyl isomerase [bacterium]